MLCEWCSHTACHRGPQWKMNSIYTNSFCLFGTKITQLNAARWALGRPLQLFLIHKVFECLLGNPSFCTSKKAIVVDLELKDSIHWVGFIANKQKLFVEIEFTFHYGLYDSQYDYIIHIALIATSCMSLNILGSSDLWKSLLKASHFWSVVAPSQMFRGLSVVDLETGCFSL